MRLRICQLLVLLFVSTLAFAQGDGVNFSSGKWQEILKIAQEEDKYIFMDAYTTWCGPCKKMSAEVFPHKKVGDFFNKKFINVKMDMEKGEGPNLGDKYNVFAYPTLLFLSPEGTLVHRVAGYHNVDEFVEQGNIALDPSKNLAAMNQRFVSGERDPDFLRMYSRVRYEAADGSHGPVAKAYLKTQKDWSTPDNLRFILTFCESADSKMFDYLTENRNSFIETFGKREVVAKIQNLIYTKIYDSEESTSLEQIDALYEKAYPEQAAELSSHFRITYFRQLGDRAGFANAVVNHFNNFPAKDPGELNDLAWTFFEVIEDKELLQGGLDLALRSINMDSAYYNHDTAAALYYKMENKRKAKKYAKKAIKLAKKSQEDYSLTEELLTKIKAM